MRTLTYAEAIREAHAQLLAADPRVFVIGQGLWSPWYAGSSLEDLDKEFGKDRILDSPVSENAITGLAVGAALAGMRPIVFHPRMDFMLLAMDPLVNQAANWSYLFAGQTGVPVVVSRGDQSRRRAGRAALPGLHAIFLHVPGIKVVMPATPADAKGLLIAAVEDPNPVLYIDDRWLVRGNRRGAGRDDCDTHWLRGGAPRGVRRHPDRYLLYGATSGSAPRELEREGISAEVIDLQKPEAVGPGDGSSQCSQDRARGGGGPGMAHRWGIGGDCRHHLRRRPSSSLRSPVERVALPDAPAPTSRGRRSRLLSRRGVKLHRPLAGPWSASDTGGRGLRERPDAERIGQKRPGRSGIAK